MKNCTKCGESKPEDQYYKNGDRLHSWCRSCCLIQTSQGATRRRQRIKKALVEERGGKCSDCGTTGPPYIFDFDHRNPEEKEFTISGSSHIGEEKIRAEANKCDLVCANCHRIRTHRQRCPGCETCSEEWVEIPSRKKSAEYHNCKCGKRIKTIYKMCGSCFKIDWPPIEEVVEKVKSTNFLQASRYYGVSDNGIRKFLKRNGYDLKTLKNNGV